jgi:hypothetical protein
MKNKTITDMGPKFTPRYWVGDQGYLTKAQATKAVKAQPKTIKADPQKLAELISLASSMADVLTDFGCEDAEWYRQQITEWSPQ